MEPFDLAALDLALQGTCFHGKLHHFKQIDSTNTRALMDAQAGAAAGQVYLADEQTAGRGRGGHTWHSEPEDGLYMTVLLRPALHGNEALKLSLMAALAAAFAIDDVLAFPIDVRWPNDLVEAPGNGSSRKFGGILTETALSPNGMLRHAAVGIGLNLNQTSFPPDLEATATSLRMALTSIVTPREELIDRVSMASAILRRLDEELSRLESSTEASNDASLLDRFSAFSSWVSGKHVRVAEGGGYTGVTAGLDDAGLLRVQCDDGTVRVVRHGGVREL